MEMKVIKSEKGLCTCCMEEHEVKTVLIKERTIFKNVNVNYDAIYMQMKINYRKTTFILRTPIERWKDF